MKNFLFILLLLPCTVFSQHIELSGFTSDSLYVTVNNFDLDVYKNDTLILRSRITKVMKMTDRVRFWRDEYELGDIMFENQQFLIKRENFFRIID